MTDNIKQEIIEKLKLGRRLSLRDLAKEFFVDLEILRSIVKAMPEVETSEFNTATFLTLAKEPSFAVSPTHNKFKGEYKPSQQMNDAMARCRADRGGEFSNLSISSKVGVYKNLK